MSQSKFFSNLLVPVDFSLGLTIFSSIEFLGFSASRGEKVLFFDKGSDRLKLMSDAKIYDLHITDLSDL